MDEADEDAEAVVREAEGDSGDDDGLIGILSEIYAPATAPVTAAPALAAAAPIAVVAAAPAAEKPLKNKDSSDEECACAPNKETSKQKASIRAKQEKR
jgi:hypothetical protein